MVKSSSWLHFCRPFRLSPVLQEKGSCSLFLSEFINFQWPFSFLNLKDRFLQTAFLSKAGERDIKSLLSDILKSSTNGASADHNQEVNLVVLFYEILLSSRK